jgi:nucleoside-diphosphate-sugar epimerase
MNVLVIGGSRFVGKEIVRQAMRAGHSVTVFNRGLTASKSSAALIRGDLENLGRYRPQLLALKPDVVIHCIAYTEKHAHACVDVFKNTGIRVIVLSSMDCYDAFQAANRGKENSDFPIDEQMPTTAIRHYWRGFSHAGGEDYDKNLMTDAFLKAHSEGMLASTILRLPMIYGPEDHQYGNRHGEMIRRILDKMRDFPMTSLDQAQIATHGYIENVAATVIHCLAHPETAGKIYNIGETMVRTRRRWAELYANAAGWEFKLRILPEEILAKNRKSRDFPAQHLIFDCSSFLKETGFIDPVSLEDGIRKTLTWGLEHPDQLGTKPNYAEESRLITLFEQTMDDLHVRLMSSLVEF